MNTMVPPSRPLTKPEEFVSAGLIAPAEINKTAEVVARYSAAVTPHLLSLIDVSDPRDPIARQYIPDPRELVTQENESADPIGDSPHTPVEGIVHRYDDRVLLKLVTICPVYCRFCFRRETVGAGKGSMLSASAFEEALAYIRAHSRIWEVILTGGDPLALSPRRLGAVIQAVSDIGHVKILRIHTRAPVADPAIVTPELIAALTQKNLSTVVALHANHPREIGEDLRRACNRLQRAGISLVSQTVLLKGVNDSVDVLTALMRAFVEAGVKPYYLHHPDLAPGTSHFRLNLAEGRDLYTALSARISGLARPAYVIDIPGGFGKVAVMSTAVTPLGDGRWRIIDRMGGEHIYRENWCPGRDSNP